MSSSFKPSVSDLIEVFQCTVFLEHAAGSVENKVAKPNDPGFTRQPSRRCQTSKLHLRLWHMRQGQESLTSCTGRTKHIDILQRRRF